MLNFYQSKEDTKLRAHFQNLIALAKIDASLDKAELNMLYKVGERYGYSNKDVDSMVRSSDTFDVIVPEDDHEKFEQLYDLVQLMLADGVIEQHEINFFCDMANQLGIDRSIATPLMRKIAFGLIEGLKREDVKESTSIFLKYS